MSRKSTLLSCRSLCRAALAGSVLGLLGLGKVEEVEAAAFVPGDVVIYRVGDGATNATTTTTAAVFLDEYTPTGTLVQSIALPTSAGTGSFALTATTSTSEGLMNLSADGRYLTLAGYNVAPGAAFAGALRTIGIVDANGVVDTSTTTSAFTSSNVIRSVVSTNGQDLWMTGATIGVVYTTRGSAGAGVTVANNATTLRNLDIYDGQLYVSANTGTLHLGTVGTGTPTTSGQAITNLTGFPTTFISYYQFAFFDLDPSVVGVDTAYVTDDSGTTGGISKYSLVGGIWTLNGTIPNNGNRGLTGSAFEGAVTLFATTSTTLSSYTDTAGYNAAPSGTLNNIATASANTAFRGIDFTPGTVAVPEAGTGFYLLAGFGMFSLLRPRTARRAGLRR